MADAESTRTDHLSEAIRWDTDQFVFMDDQVVDSLMSTVLELSAELWSIRRRQLVTEAVLALLGHVAIDAIESYRPTPEQEVDWAAQRDRFVKRSFAPFARKVAVDRPSVEHHPFMDAQ